MGDNRTFANTDIEWPSRTSDLFPEGSITDVIGNVIDEVLAQNALKHNDRPVDIIVTEH